MGPIGGGRVGRTALGFNGSVTQTPREAARVLIDALGGVDAGWQRVLIFHGVQAPMILGLTLVVSAITFFTVEIRFRPHLYKWDSSRYVRSMLAAAARRPR